MAGSQRVDTAWGDDTTGFPVDPEIWRLVIAVPSCGSGKLQRTEMAPIWLGQKKSPATTRPTGLGLG